MRRILVYGAMVLAALSATGCDFFRKVAGRPTSEDIAAKREYIERQEEIHRARLDSLAKVEKQAADSVAALDRLRQEGTLLMNSSRLGGLASASLPRRYYTIIGAFSNSDNAGRLAAKAVAAGLETVRIPCQNGYTAVGVSPVGKIVDVCANLPAIMALDFCPKDVWILVNE